MIVGIVFSSVLQQYCRRLRTSSHAPVAILQRENRATTCPGDVFAQLLYLQHYQYVLRSMKNLFVG